MEEPNLDVEAELERLHARSFGWALSCCGWDREEAADILQASYLKVLDGRARFGQRSRFSTWLFGVIRRTAWEHRRRRLSRSLLLLRHASEVPLLNQGIPDSVSVETDGLKAALSRLPRRQREVVHLVFYDEMSIREAATTMGVGLGTARIHYERAKKRLRTQLKESRELEHNP